MPVNKKYTHIFFDLDNTLWDFEKNSVQAMLATYNHFNIEKLLVDFESFFQIYSKHNHQLWDDYRQKKVIKRELIRRRFQQTFDELNIKNIDPEETNSYYLQEMPKQNLLQNGAVDVLNYLKQKGYKLFIITNGFKEVQYKKLKNSGLSHFFANVFISEVIKVPKPGKEIFEYSIKSANAKKIKSIMIGDDWEVDVLGAVAFGIDAVFYNPHNKIVDEKNGNDRKNQIRSIHELGDLVAFL